ISTVKEPRELIRPIPELARDILAGMDPNRPFVFDYDGHPITNMGQRLAKLQIAAGVFDWSAHDLRRTMRSWMEGAPPDGCGFPEGISEECLGHKMHGVKAVYNKWQYLAEKRTAYEAWNDFLMGIIQPPPAARDAVVVPIKRKPRAA